MTKTRWVIVFLVAPILIPLALFGFCGPEAKEAGVSLLKVYLALIGVLFVAVAIGMGLN
jgi:hypothetical protein